MKFRKHFYNALLLFLTLFIWACPNQYLGQVLPPGDYLGVSQSGHHRVEHKLFIMEYQCDVDRRAGFVTFDGGIRFKEKESYKEWLLDELRVTVYFMNSDRKVIAVDHITPEPEALNADIIKFKRKFKYKSDFRYVTHSYESRASILHSNATVSNIPPQSN